VAPSDLPVKGRRRDAGQHRAGFSWLRMLVPPNSALPPPWAQTLGLAPRHHGKQRSSSC
jgi:hypothetical protein